jgi:hypothetical protein
MIEDYYVERKIILNENDSRAMSLQSTLGFIFFKKCNHHNLLPVKSISDRKKPKREFVITCRLSPIRFSIICLNLRNAQPI